MMETGRSFIQLEGAAANNTSIEDYVNNYDSYDHSGGGKKIICLELYRQGLMDPLIFKTDEEFGDLFPYAF